MHSQCFACQRPPAIPSSERNAGLVPVTLGQGHNVLLAINEEFFTLKVGSLVVGSCLLESWCISVIICQIWAQLLCQLQGRQAGAVAVLSHLQMSAVTFRSFDAVDEYMCLSVDLLPVSIDSPSPHAGCGLCCCRFLSAWYTCFSWKSLRTSRAARVHC